MRGPRFAAALRAGAMDRARIFLILAGATVLGFADFRPARGWSIADRSSAYRPQV